MGVPVMKHEDLPEDIPEAPPGMLEALGPLWKKLMTRLRRAVEVHRRDRAELQDAILSVVDLKRENKALREHAESLVNEVKSLRAQLEAAERAVIAEKDKADAAEFRRRAEIGDRRVARKRRTAEKRKLQ